jgi:Na+-translocating ferredoxin:NAD+ oxidoreductase RnfG subunit
MIKKIQYFLFALLVSVFMLKPVYANMPAKIDRKIDKYIKKHLDIKELKKTAIHLSEDQMKNLDFDCYKNQLFDVAVNEESIGFIYIDKAHSRHDVFTFMVLMSYDLQVKLVRVLDYNETHGIEISNKRWLSQFIDFTPDSKIEFERNIDAISGATISARSITKAVAEVLKKSKQLKEAGII